MANLHWLANPGRFLRITAVVLPWLAAATAVLLAVGLWLALRAPQDATQGAPAKIMYMHVPSAILSMTIFGAMAFASAIALIWRHPLADIGAKASAAIGAGFTATCLITGSLWGRPSWGTFWVWDARLTSELILFFIYLGYIAIWQAIEDPQRASRAAAIVALAGSINLPIIHYSVVWWNTLHQPPGLMQGRTDPSMAVPLLTLMGAFFLFYVTLLLRRMEREIVDRKIRQFRLLRAQA
ncbi:MAG: heme ABC transporter permease [Alphaproteobacteria bacterium]|nr:heme ABC transporter permease [Alphaproteobacteria bacterium]